VVMDSGIVWASGAELDGASPVSKGNRFGQAGEFARWTAGGGCPYASIAAPASEPTWHCLNSRKPVIVILLSGFLSTTDSREWRGNQVPPRYRKSCIRFPAFLSTRLASVSPSTTHGLSISKRSRNLHFSADKSESPSGADPFPKRLPTCFCWSLWPLWF